MDKTGIEVQTTPWTLGSQQGEPIKVRDTKHQFKTQQYELLI